ncbi:hypothetical protein [Streptomyces sp. TP-A0356]|uniref:hypothetical protein n=1 Tax=Streptomyces sp. TP-A0356 TaxID=1359208 RepID=UPI0006E178E0|nr:hypothetical protein [Streptomyces sp. TP-A0356]
MLLRLAYVTITAVTLLCLLPMNDRDKDLEILPLRHQLLVLQHHVGKPAFTETDRVILSGLLHHLPREKPYLSLNSTLPTRGARERALNCDDS